MPQCFAVPSFAIASTKTPFTWGGIKPLLMRVYHFLQERMNAFESHYAYQIQSYCRAAMLYLTILVLIQPSIIVQNSPANCMLTLSEQRGFKLNQSHSLCQAALTHLNARVGSSI
jgi:hypothetical protein